MGRGGDLLSAGGRALHASPSLRGRQERPSLPHQAQDSPTTGGTRGGFRRALQGGSGRLLLRRRRGFQARFERTRGGIRALFEGFSLLVAQRGGADRGAVGGGFGGRMEERRGIGRVEEGDAHLPRRAPGEMVGFGGRGGTLLPGEVPKGARGHHRYRKVAPPADLVPDHQPACSWFRATNRERFSPC